MGLFLIGGSCIEFVEKTGMTNKVNLTEGNCSSGHFFMDFTNKTAVDIIFKPFLQCAYTMKCITPKGSDKSNHRQEQAGITVFLHNAHLMYSAVGKYSHVARFRQERLGDDKMRELRKELMKEIERRNGIVISLVCYQ